MKFICPESQKRVSFKCGSMVSTASSAGGSPSSVEATTAGIGFDGSEGDGSGTCCASAGKTPASAMTRHR